MSLIKALNFDRYGKFPSQLKNSNKKIIFRYKIIVVVTVIEKFMEGICYSGKNLWDVAKDSVCTYIYDHKTFFAIGMCYAIYFD